MGSPQRSGRSGEEDVLRRIRCPNCAKPLMSLPRNYPLYDVQCTGCLFRAQVKSASARPRDQIFGAGWDSLRKVMKSGHLIPPLIVNYRWRVGTQQQQEIRFYPFVPRANVRHRVLAATAKRANYRMFSYVGLAALPHIKLYTREPRAPR